MFDVRNETEMLHFAGWFANLCRPPLVIYLSGQLGAGKTTFTRGFLKGLGYSEKVKSPTYTLVEPYALKHFILYHFDFYRIQNPEELEWIGIRDYFHTQSFSLIEWPELGGDKIPEPDIVIKFHIVGERRQLEILAVTDLGESVIQNLTAKK